MARIIETTVYTFDELSDKAKERAREWWRECESQDSSWHECIIEDATHMAGIIGITVKNIYWSGFSSQGDGACFEGSYSYRPEAVAEIKAEAPTDAKLHVIAQDLADVQAQHGNRLDAIVRHTSNHYYHERSVSIEVMDSDDNDRDLGDDAEVVAELLRDFMRWIYRQLESAYDWTMADEQVDENIRANEYEFTVDGKIA